MLHGDTHPRARRLLTELLRRRSPEERLRMAITMSEEARELARAGARLRNPAASAEVIERMVAELYLGADLLRRVEERRAKAR